MRFPRSCLVLSNVALFAVCAAAQQATSTPCAISPVGAKRPATTLAVGTYELTLVATTGLKTGNATTGSLWLTRTTPSDSSPKTGHRPARSGRRGVPYYGSAVVDFERVGAPVFRDDTLVPPPESRDPVRPGVLVLLQNWQTDTLPRTLVLVIGSLSNRRDDEGWMDGPGIGLWVRSTTGSDFSGDWYEFGIIRGGQGHFCARYLGS